MTTVANEMKHNQHHALKGVAITLSLIVYLAGLVYAAVRSYSLFAATIDPALLPLAVIGIVALELTAIGLPLAIHFWTQPGAQRMAAYAFYLVDLALIACNAILDAGRHNQTILPGFLTNYGIYVLPALPLLCMAGWSLMWLLDPSSRERDMRESVKAATHAALLSQIQQATEQADVTEAVEEAANEAPRALVGETLGNAPRRAVSEPARPTVKRPALATVSYNADSEAMPTTTYSDVLDEHHPNAKYLKRPYSLAKWLADIEHTADEVRAVIVKHGWQDAEAAYSGLNALDLIPEEQTYTEFTRERMRGIIGALITPKPSKNGRKAVTTDPK